MTTIKNLRTPFNTGRSILEVLAVLALIGLLSIASVSGYRYLIDQHKANETIHDVMLRAANVPMMDSDYKTRGSNYEWYFTELPERGEKGTFYEMHTRGVTTTEAPYIYKVDVFNVPGSICKKILELNPTDVDLIRVDSKNFIGDNIAICGSGIEAISMAFYFDGDWTSKAPIPPEEECECPNISDNPPCPKATKKDYIYTCSNNMKKNCFLWVGCGECPKTVCDCENPTIEEYDYDSPTGKISCERCICPQSPDCPQIYDVSTCQNKHLINMKD